MKQATDDPKLSIKDLTQAYRDGRLSPLKVIDDSLAKAESANRLINAFTTICRDEALARAAEIDKALRDGCVLGPLAGVPITVKDIISTKGIRTTHGSAAFSENYPGADAICVERLKNAGAIIIGKTATPEFACRQTTSSAISGISRNPWNLELTPGGSSGGSAAATAYGIGFVSLVTDGGGSARLPAACTGLVGMKPTFGRIPFDSALDAFSGLGHIGLMARNTADLDVALTAAAGPHPMDPYSLAGGGAPPDTRECNIRSFEGLRFGLRRRLADECIDSDFNKPVDDVVKLLEARGANVMVLEDEIEPPLPIWRVLQHSIWAERYGDRPDLLKTIDPVIAAGIEHAQCLTARSMQAALHGRTRLFRHVQNWFGAVDFIISPTLTRPPLAATHPGYGPIMVAGRPAGDIREAWGPLLGLFTMTGHPSISLNCGWTKGGLPVGLHLVGRWHADRQLLRLASILEKAMPDAAWRMPPPLAMSLTSGETKE